MTYASTQEQRGRRGNPPAAFDARLVVCSPQKIDTGWRRGLDTTTRCTRSRTCLTGGYTVHVAVGDAYLPVPSRTTSEQHTGKETTFRESW